MLEIGIAPRWRSYLGRSNHNLERENADQFPMVEQRGQTVMNLKFRILAVVVVFTTLLGLYSARLWPASQTNSNFEMYYTAAYLVRQNMSVHIYDAVNREANPEIIYADPSTVWAKTAHAHGINRVTLYLYPPILADLVVPLTFFPVIPALVVWHILGILMIVGISVTLTRTLDMGFSGSIVLVSAAVLLFRPTLSTFHWGQASVIIAFLVTIGLSLYVRGNKNVAALLLVLAIAIKLEPIALIVPVIVWRDWKFLRSMAVWGLLLCLGMWAVNGTEALKLYFLYQLPAMSGGKLGTGSADVNRTLGNIFYAYLDGMLSSREVSWLVHLISALVLCSAGWLSRSKHREKLTARRQFEIGLIFLLLVCCLSPYSWYYNWAIVAPPAVMFCKRVWDRTADTAESAVFIALLLSLTTSQFDMAMVTPFLGIMLGLLALYRMRLERPAQSRIPIDRLVTSSAS